MMRRLGMRRLRRTGGERGGAGLRFPTLDLWLGGLGADGRGLDRVAITSPGGYSGGAGPLVRNEAGQYVGKPAGYLAALHGCRLDGSTPRWTTVGGDPLNNVVWRGPQPLETELVNATLNISPDVFLLSGDNATPVSAQIIPTSLAHTLTITGGVSSSYRGIGTLTSGSTFMAWAVVKPTPGQRAYLSVFGGSYVNRSAIVIDDSGNLDRTFTNGSAPTPTNIIIEPLGSGYFFIAYNSSLVNQTMHYMFVSAASATGNPSSNNTPGHSCIVEAMGMRQQAFTTRNIIATSGDSLTRLAETVSAQHVFGEYTLVMNVDLAEGVPTVDSRFIGSSSGSLGLPFLRAAGTMNLYDGATEKTAGPAITSGATRLGVRRRAGAWSHMVNGTVGDYAAGDLAVSGPTTLLIGHAVAQQYLNRPIHRARIWSRGLGNGEWADA